MNNPLLENHDLPPFDQISPEHVVPAIEALLGECRETVEFLVSSGASTWDTLVTPLERAHDRLNQAWSPVSHLNAVTNSDALRAAYNNCVPIISAYHTELAQNASLFSAFELLQESEGYAQLSMAQKKIIQNELRGFRLSGVDLSEKSRRRFAEIEQRLSVLSSKFSENVLDATQDWSLLVDKDLLKGLPDSLLAMLQQAAEIRGETGYLLTLEFPSYNAVMTYCDDSALREKVYRAYATRASELGPEQWDNSEVIEEILSLKREMAQILGYASYADVSLQTKMAKTTGEVLSFLNDLAGRSRPAAQEEFAKLSEFALKEGVEDIRSWDLAYYSEKLKKQMFDISDEDIRVYFPAHKVIEGLLEIVRRLYDIEIEQTHNVTTWHNDVTTYNLYRGGSLIARCYMDLYARSNKRGGAWMDECRVRRVDNGHIQLPVAYLTCNFSAPVGDSPSLLTHREVVTLFHEFGHGLHHMLTQVDYAGASGINGVAWDAVELPSQFLENWCWQEEALEIMSSHFETGAPLPGELLKKLLSARNFQSAMMMVRQLEFALFDFRLHVEFDTDEQNQVQRILDEVRKEVSVVPFPSFHRFQHGFSHIFSGGYAAGYYSYKWAEVLAADAFSKFAEDGVFNRQTAEKFLSTVLEQGGSKDAMELFVAFRGREPDVRALLNQDGIRNV